MNARCFPVLDIPTRGTHNIIGIRAYLKEKETVIALGRTTAQRFIDRGVLLVMKHIRETWTNTF
ncbi:MULTISPECIES: hypothetical protein [unclassified Bartonella]|uniref:hypothetical protein n=1 Tax=unclassified Bartonella TaxID=2645622 RepID=UPI002362072E|nr:MULTISPECIES: hypothetical protein [unclassified Bartonella]